MPIEKAPEKPTSTTNWNAFVKAQLIPKEVICNGYAPYHRADMSCHTRLAFKVDTLASHIKADHGGGFKFSLRKGDVVWPGWEALAQAGMEVHDFRCDICDEQIPLSAIRITSHMRPHSGKTRRVRPGGDFLITLSFEKPLGSDDSELL